MAGKVQIQRATQELREEFERLMPGVQTAARFTFRVKGLRGEALGEAVQEATAMAFVAFLAERAKPESEFTSASLGQYAARQYSSGRRAAGSVPAKEAMGVIAKRNNGHAVESLSETIDGLLAKHESPADAAAFRVDSASWLERLGERDRRMVGEMAEGYTNQELADEFAVSRARISQKRREFAEALSR